MLQYKSSKDNMYGEYGKVGGHLMARKKFYITVDTETCTLPFVNEWNLTPSQKQKIAIAKPLVYDLGWVVTDRQGNICKQRNFLIQETFFVPNVFNTAYYVNKRPIYMDLLAKGEIEVATWDNAFSELLADMEQCDIATAYNACFDFKKAIPFTERYMSALYSNDYIAWEKSQRQACEKLIKGIDDSKNDDYLNPHVKFRDIEFDICDLWKVSCERLINIDKYRNYCLENGLLTKSAQYFKTSAETSFQYLMKDHDFVEDHTALSDAIIESMILTKALKKGKVEATLGAFPFRELGTTYDYVLNKKKQYIGTLADAYEEYIENNCFTNSGYWTRVQNEYERLRSNQ